MPTIYVQRGCPNGLEVLKFQQSTPFVESYEIHVPSSILGFSLSSLLGNAESRERSDFHIKYKAQSIEPGASPLEMAETLVNSGPYKQSSKEMYEELERRYLNA